MNCPLCFSQGTAVFAHWPEFTVSRCVECGFRFVDTSEACYPRNAQFAYDEPHAGPVRPDLPHIRRRVADVMRFKRPPGSALEVGCGKGELALALQGEGFDCVGIDMNPRLIANAQANFPQVTWRRATLAELASEPRRFDLVTMYHVLEHIDDPRAALASVKSLANPGALIVVEVPNVAGWEARLSGRRWHYYKVDHVSYFRKSDLRKLASDLGLGFLGSRGYQHFSYPQDVPWKDLVKGALARLGFVDVVSVFLRAP